MPSLGANPKPAKLTLPTFENESESRSVVSDSSRPHGLYSLWNSPGQKTGFICPFLPHGIFPTQGSNPGPPHCRQILYYLNHQGSPRILEWVASPFFWGSYPPRNQTGVSCIAGGSFTNSAIREAHLESDNCLVCEKVGEAILSMVGCLAIS